MKTKPVGSLLKGHLKPQQEPWCKEVLFYSPSNQGDYPQDRVMVYALDEDWLRDLDNDLKYIQRVLESEATPQDRATARNMVSAIRKNLRSEATTQCACGDRLASECPGEWEPGCDLGANEKHVRPAQPDVAAQVDAALGIKR